MSEVPIRHTTTRDELCELLRARALTQMATIARMRELVPSRPDTRSRRGQAKRKTTSLSCLRRKLPSPGPSRLAIRARAYDKTWSNPTGQVLTPVVDGVVWAAERPFIWNSIDVGGKMGVVKLEDGTLWVHSPVDLDALTKNAIDALGSVRHVVSPNFEHVKWAAQWKEAYPDATLWGCPDMKQKYPEIPWDEELVDGEGNFGGARAEFAATWFNCETNPFTGKPFFNETVFVHKPTRVLFVTDLFWNYPDGAEAVDVDETHVELPLGTKAWKFGMDRLYLPFYRKAMVRDAARFATKRDALLPTFDAVLPCHGAYVASGGAKIVEEHLKL